MKYFPADLSSLQLLGRMGLCVRLQQREKSGHTMGMAEVGTALDTYLDNDYDFTINAEKSV